MQNTILIIGASGTIGRAIAEQLHKDNQSLILHGRVHNDRLASLSETLNSPIFAADLINDEEVSVFIEAVLKKHPRLAGIVFCAARPFPHKLTHRTKWSVFQEQIESQLKALHNILQGFRPALENLKEGARIVILSSEYVVGTPPTKIAPYIAAKAALTAYGQIIAQESLNVGIRVHILAPGMVKSALTADMPDEYLDMIAEEMPEGKLTNATDVARVCSFLLTPDADPLYGTIIPVSRANRR